MQRRILLGWTPVKLTGISIAWPKSFTSQLRLADELIARPNALGRVRSCLNALAHKASFKVFYMLQSKPMLHLVCGKIAAGKSTLTSALGSQPGTVLVSEDHWLAHLYPGEMNSIADYARNSARLRDAIAAHLVMLLKGGMSVVLDFPANTPASRAWMRTIFVEAECAHQLHYIDVPDELCKARLRSRNKGGEHEFNVSEEIFDLFSRHFVPPASDEGFEIVIHRP